MDADAIKQIQNTAIEAAAGRAAAIEGGTQIVLPDDHRVIDLEQFQPGRRRFRGALRTDSLADFIGYVNDRHGEGIDGGCDGQVPGFIDSDRLSATCIFNLGTRWTPGHADDTAALTLKASAPYAAMTQVDGKHLVQKDAIDWLEDWIEHIAFEGQDGKTINNGVAIATIRKITIRSTAEATTTQENFRANRSAMEEVEARGADNLPAAVLFTCTPYAGLPQRTFRLRFGVLTSTDKPTIVLRIRNLEAEKEAIAQDFKRALLTDLADVATLTIGTFAA